jgi:tellurite resistance protein
MEHEERPLSDRLTFFPITAFASILGLGGFTVLLDKWRHLRWLPSWPYYLMTGIVTALFLVLAALYAYKALRAFPLVVKDFQHKVRINFMAAISISLLILSIIYMGCCPFASLSFWYMGTAFHTIIMFVIFKRWINHEFDIQHFNPAWFIPVVGLVLIPVAGVDYAPREVVLFYFANGVMYWLVFFSIALYRIIFHPPMPAKLAPTLFMLMAPPAVIFISYMRIAMHFDLFAKSLLFIALFVAILLLFVKRQFEKLDFFMSWWAFTFPLDALAIAVTLAFMTTRSPGYMYLSWAASLIALGVLAVVTFHTIKGIWAGNICVEED